MTDGRATPETLGRSSRDPEAWGTPARMFVELLAREAGFRANTGSTLRAGKETSTPWAKAVALLERLVLYDLGPEHGYLAWEVVRCEEGLDPEERWSLYGLVLASLAARSAGSTYLPLDGEGASYAQEVVGRLLDDQGAWDTAVRLLEEGRLETIVGKPGELRPLVVEGTALYHQKLRVFEERLAQVLAPRLMAAQSAPGASEKPTEAWPSLEAIEVALKRIKEHPATFKNKEVFLSEEQEEAVRKCACLPLTLVTGGPGTGKTSTIVGMLRLLVRLGIAPSDIALAAPTGKAAARMKQAIDVHLNAIRSPEPEDVALKGAIAPKTLHRLLGASADGERFKHHEDNPLSERVVIVDECSMIDLALMDRLLRAVKPEARLVLLGDAEQLPSVEAGTVFCDLVAVGEGKARETRPRDRDREAAGQNEVRETRTAGRDLVSAGEGVARKTRTAGHAIPKERRHSVAVRLTHSYRMDEQDPGGRRILMVARCINEGDDAALFAPKGAEPQEHQIFLRAQPSDLAWQGVEMIEAAVSGQGGFSLKSFLEAWFAQRILALNDLGRLIRHRYVFGKEGFSPEDRAKLEKLFGHFESHKILCVTRSDRRPTSAEQVNEFLHNRFLKEFWADDEGARQAEFLAGTPILVLENDYERTLCNGDQGLVLWVADKNTPEEKPATDRRPPMAVFRRGTGEYVAFELSALRGRLQRAFAMTVHKGQGSEFDRVALVLPDQSIPLVVRELIYTAVTRSRKSTVIFGSRDVLGEGVRRRAERFCGLGERLRSMGAAP